MDGGRSGSVNFASATRLAQDRDGFTYLNPDAHIRHGLAMCERFALHPSYAVYEPGFMRQATAMAERYYTADICLPSNVLRGLCIQLPPKAYGLDAYLALLERRTARPGWLPA